MATRTSSRRSNRSAAARASTRNRNNITRSNNSNKSTKTMNRAQRAKLRAERFKDGDPNGDTIDDDGDTSDDHQSNDSSSMEEEEKKTSTDDSKLLSPTRRSSRRSSQSKDEIVVPSSTKNRRSGRNTSTTNSTNSKSITTQSDTTNDSDISSVTSSPSPSPSEIVAKTTKNINSNNSNPEEKPSSSIEERKDPVEEEEDDKIKPINSNSNSNRNSKEGGKKSNHPIKAIPSSTSSLTTNSKVALAKNNTSEKSDDEEPNIFGTVISTSSSGRLLVSSSVAIPAAPSNNSKSALAPPKPLDGKKKMRFRLVQNGSGSKQTQQKKRKREDNNNTKAAVNNKSNSRGGGSNSKTNRSKNANRARGAARGRGISKGRGASRGRGANRGASRGRGTSRGGRQQFPNHSRPGTGRSGTIRPWHGGRKDEKVRKELIDKIMALLNSCKRGEKQVRQKLVSLARRLEAALYKGAKTKAEYQSLGKDPDHLRFRVRELARESAMRRAILSAATPEAAAAAAASAGASLEEQKKVREQHTRILKQRTRLMLLRHAARCTEADDKCVQTPHCSQVKKLWRHVLDCRQTRCDYPHCITSRHVLAHYRQCRDVHCLVCGPVRKAARRNKEEERERMRGPCEGYRKPGLLESLKDNELEIHIKECKTEAMQTVLGLVLRRLMESKKNRGTFNSVIDVVKLNIPHYNKIVTTPMDLGTIRKRLETLAYNDPQQFAVDVRLVFQNAMKFNPLEHNVHICARELLEQFEEDFEKALQRLDPTRPLLMSKKNNGTTPRGGKKGGNKMSRRPQSQAKKALMRGILAPRKNGLCTLCGDATCVQCPMCDSGCRSFESPSLHCRGPCGSRVVRNSSFWALPSTNYFIWCQSCYENMHRRKEQVIGDRIITKLMLIKKKNNAILGEPWVQCDVCNAWQHQICCMYNARAEAKYEDGKFVCPLCRHKIMKEEKDDKEEKMKQEKEQREKEENDNSLALAADLLGSSSTDTNNIGSDANTNTGSASSEGAKDVAGNKKSVTFKSETGSLKTIYEDDTPPSSVIGASPLNSMKGLSSVIGGKHHTGIRVDTNVRTPMPSRKSPSSSPLPMPSPSGTPPQVLLQDDINIVEDGNRTKMEVEGDGANTLNNNNNKSRKNTPTIPIDESMKVLPHNDKTLASSSSKTVPVATVATPSNSQIPPKTPKSAASTLLTGDRPPGAIELPSCELSRKLQDSVDQMLLKDRAAEAERLNIPVSEVQTAENICIRVVSAIDKEVKVLPRLASRTKYPEKLNYRSKAILMFQRGQDDIDICLFAMYVQEYGHDSQDPNKRFSYIAYLDSVNYLKPRRLRTQIYHELLVAYLDAIKIRGFSTVFIWACPPPHKRDDYILHCHPETQRMPSADRLREWYHEMIALALKRKIVVESTTLYEEYIEYHHPQRIKRRIAMLKKRQQMESNYEKQKAKKMLEEQRKKEEALNGGKKKTEKPKSKPAKRTRRPILLAPVRTISPRQTRSKRKSTMMNAGDGINGPGTLGDVASGGTIATSNDTAVTAAVGAGGVVQASNGLLSLPLGGPTATDLQNVDRKKAMKSDEEILEELEPNVSRPLAPAMLPYFEGDFWVAEGELALKLFIKDDIKKREEEAEQKILDAGGRRLGRARKKRKTKNYAEEKISALLLSDSKNLVSSSTAAAAVTATNAAVTTTTAAAAVPTKATVGDKNGKAVKNNKDGGVNGSAAKEEEDEEEKFVKLSLEQREKETSRLMRKMATMMEVMKPDFLVCKLKHTCFRCHKYILNGTRYKCDRCESVGHPFNLCQSCHDIEAAKTGLTKTLHQVHCERVREDAAFSLGGGNNSGFKRLLSFDREHMSKIASKKASGSTVKKEVTSSSSSSSTHGDKVTESDEDDALTKTTSSPVSRRSSRRSAGDKSAEDVPSLEDVLRRNKMKNSRKPEEGSVDLNGAKNAIASVKPYTKLSAKKAAIPDKVKANEQRRSKALAAKRATYENLIEIMAWEEDEHVMDTSEETTVLDTKDPDEILDCPILNTRLALLGVCQGNRYQFDQKRRAKHSTMMLLYHLHNPKVPLYVHTCNECQKDILGNCRFHCSQCPDFDLCARCYRDVHHIHRLKRVEVDVSGTGDEETNKEDRKKRSLALFLESLVHATACRGCSRPECRKMKDLLMHRNHCKIRASGGCDTCQRILCLLQIHARQCKVEPCKVLYCKVLKRRIQASKERKKLEKAKQEAIVGNNSSSNIKKGK